MRQHQFEEYHPHSTSRPGQARPTSNQTSLSKVHDWMWLIALYTCAALFLEMDPFILKKYKDKKKLRGLQKARKLHVV